MRLFLRVSFSAKKGSGAKLAYCSIKMRHKIGIVSREGGFKNEKEWMQ